MSQRRNPQNPDLRLQGTAGLRTRKYNNRYVKDDGYTFDSGAEHRRYCELKLLLRGGKIKDLIVHPRYPVVIGVMKICTVEMDFEYYNYEQMGKIVEDIKGFDPPISKLKRKLLQALYPDMTIHILTAR